MVVVVQTPPMPIICDNVLELYTVVRELRSLWYKYVQYCTKNILQYIRVLLFVSILPNIRWYRY